MMVYLCYFKILPLKVGMYVVKMLFYFMTPADYTQHTYFLHCEVFEGSV